ncbi:MAG TPA: hypothetical protein VGP43_04935 [Chitinophagaceae bacterium]|nr:hypothetical protein [Chitinophagaceae bacterium]
MSNSFLYNIPAFLIAVFLFAGILVFHILGFKIIKYQKNKDPEFSTAGIGPLEGALLGLISLLLAFTFNKSAANHDNRNGLLLQEANDIEAALLRADLYPDSIRKQFRNEFKEYIISRIDYYKANRNTKKIQQELDKADSISTLIWQQASKLSQQTSADNRSIQMIPAVNNMIDTMSKREVSRVSHVPESILWLLFLLIVAGSFIVGYATNANKINWIVIFVYSLMIVMTVYLILDLDRPRRGIINSDNMHHNMERLLNVFKNDL